MKTYTANSRPVDRKWVVVDADGMVLGRLATRVAQILNGKVKPTYTRNVDTGDFVVVVNAEKVVLTGNKAADKVYYWHTRYPGGLKSVTAGELLRKKPEQVIKQAVNGMLPKSKLGRQMIRKLKVYAGPDHPHQAQKPALQKF